MSDQKRLFFALPLPAELQQNIIEWRAATFAPDAGRPIAAANLHITLAFLGDVSAQKQRTLSALAGRISQPAFTLHLDDAGHWPRSQVVWLGSRQRRAACCSSRISARAGGAQRLSTSAQPFHPHVTLLRNAQHPVRLPPPGFGWALAAREFVLYESRFEKGRTRYQPLERWSLNP